MGNDFSCVLGGSNLFLGDEKLKSKIPRGTHNNNTKTDITTLRMNHLVQVQEVLQKIGLN